MSDDDTDNESFSTIPTIIEQLKKNVDPQEFARSLAPHTTLIDDEDIDAFNKFLDDLDEKVEIGSSGKIYIEHHPEDIEKLRIWSHIEFEKKRRVTDPLVVTQFQAPIINDNKGSPDTENYTLKNEVEMNDIIGEFLQEEINFASMSTNCEFNKDLAYLPVVNFEGRKIFRFFYLDAYENFFGDKTTAHLFGKTYCPQSKKYRSCCVTVSLLKRKIFVRPRTTLHSAGDEDVDKKIDLLKEFYYRALRPLKINEYNYRFVLKRNISGLQGSEPHLFLEIEYSANYLPVKYGIEGRTFSAVYGAQCNCFENFLLEKQLKGPCWIDVLEPEIVTKPKTWCSFELKTTVEGIFLTSSKLNLQAPPLSILSMQFMSDFQKDNQCGEIILISWAINTCYNLSKGLLNKVVEKSYCAFVTSSTHNLAPLNDIVNTFKRSLVKKFDSEEDMLLFFLKEYYKSDPDILIAYDFQNEDLHKFIKRVVHFRLSDASKLGRFREISKYSDMKEIIFNGRLICDMKHLMKDLYSFKSQDLSDLYKKFQIVSDKQRFPGDKNKIFPFLTENVLEIIVLSINECIYLLKLMLKTSIVPLCIQLTHISGNTLSQTFYMGFSKRCEFLLLHAFYERGFILPNKPFRKTSNDGGIDLVGGLVLDPKVGFYDDFVLLMDFQSLYPSIIYEYNLCTSHYNEDIRQYKKQPLGVIPAVMYQLLKKREEIKKIMKGLNDKSNIYFRYNTYQLALKLCANSIYGCLSLRSFRFSSPKIAQQITKIGREILDNSTNVLKNEGFEIIYGDTDSIMINTKTKELSAVYVLGQQITNLISSKYSSIQLNIDSIFERLLILTKKKYAGITVTCTINGEEVKETVLKGLDIIRNDHPIYICQMGRNIIDSILSDISHKEKILEIKKILHKISEDASNKTIPKNLLVIKKFLSQDPENYTSLNTNPHAEVAVRLNKNTFNKFKKGDTVSYVMCYDAINNSNFKTAFHLSELGFYPNYDIDIKYYLAKQFYPVISRLCAPFADIDSEIRNCFNVDAFKAEKCETSHAEKHGVQFDWKDSFIFTCLVCGKENNIAIEQVTDSELPLLSCQNSNCNFRPLENLKYLKNKLVLAMRKYISQYYRYQMKCTFAKCQYSSCRVHHNFTLKTCVCGCGKLQQTYNEIDLFLQLEYFRQIFLGGISNSRTLRITYAYTTLLQQLDNYKRQSDFDKVNLTQLFKCLCYG